MQRFAEPSDGLEPSTPPYHADPAATGRNRWQRFWRDSAVFGAVLFATDCHWLRPLGSINAPSLVACGDDTACRTVVWRD
jgi:hypothetical protein